MNKHAYLLMMLMVLFFTGCDISGSEATLPPIIMTKCPKEITQTTALSGGTRGQQIKAEILEQRVCWSYHENPTMADNVVIGTNVTTWEFDALMTGMETNTWYFVMAYLRTKSDTIYAHGSTTYFKTLE